MNIVYVKRKRKPYRRYFYGAGDNSYSVFGNGHESRFTSPTLLDVENSTDNVWKMISSNYQSGTIFGIKNDGTLWVWGSNNGGQSGLGTPANIFIGKQTQVGTDTNWDYISTNQTTAIALKTNGTLWSCGQNNNGQLGVGSTTASTTFAQVGNDTNWDKIAIGSSHVLALKTNGTLWVWGLNYNGQLGLNDTTIRTQPTQVGSDTNWSKISCGGQHSIAIKTDGTIWCCGYNNNGQCGDEFIYQQNSPGEVNLQYGTDGDEWKIVQTNQTQNGFCVGIKKDGTLWSWGWQQSFYYELGRDDGKSDAFPGQIGTDSDWETISVGNLHTLAVKTDGTLWGWGSNFQGQLQSSAVSYYETPTQIGTDTNWSKVAAGNQHSLGLKTDGTIWSWGINLNGVTGQGVSSYSFTSPPTKIGTATDWSDITAGNIHSFALKTNGTLWTWGSNNSGRTGRGTTSGTTNSPTQVGTDTNWSKVSAGNNHSLALKTNGTLWATGTNTNGQLGTGNTTQLNSFTQVGSDTNWNIISAANSYSHAIKTNGTLWATGFNGNGSLGDNTTTQRTSFVQIGNSTDWISINGGRCTVGLRGDGILWTWASNDFGQLGLENMQVMYFEFTNIISGSNWDISECSQDESMAIKTNGTLWGWGRNINGNIGTGNTTRYTSPQQIGSDTNWSKISMGSSHTLAIKTNGTLWSCGQNNSGQLGVGSTTASTTFAQVGNDTNWSDIKTGSDTSFAQTTNNIVYSWGSNFNDTLGIYQSSSGEYYFTNTITDIIDWKEIYAGGDYNNSIFGIRKDGTLWAWGDNTYGQLGLGDTVTRTIPTQVGSDTDWDKVGIGYLGNWVFAIKTNGTLWATGFNGSGILGIGNTTNQTSFVQVGSDTWSYASVGGGHSLGIKTNGTLWAWGSHSSGRTGLNLTSGQTNTPLQVGSDSNWVMATAGPFHSHAIKSNGTLWGWGANWGRQLGDNTTTQRNTPVQIGSATDWKYIKDTDTGGMGIKTNGTLWGWGNNGSGTLGSGNNTTPSIPIQVGNSTSDWAKVAPLRQGGAGIKTDGTLWTWGGSNSYGQLGNPTIVFTFTPTQVGTSTGWLNVNSGGYGFYVALRDKNT